MREIKEDLAFDILKQECIDFNESEVENLDEKATASYELDICSSLKTLSRTGIFKKAIGELKCIKNGIVYIKDN